MAFFITNFNQEKQRTDQSNNRQISNHHGRMANFFIAPLGTWRGVYGKG
ncbi:hypothetical protein [Sulfitobacter sp. MF3-043]